MLEFILCNRVEVAIVFVPRIKHDFQKRSIAHVGLLSYRVILIAITAGRLTVLNAEVT